MMMIWLVGNKGMLGREIEALLYRRGRDVIGSDREVSVLQPAVLRHFLRGRKISWIINCAAYTAVDKAEDDEETATLLNADGVRNLAVLAKELDARLIHFSTDYVFDGMRSEPYREEEEAHPISAYGRSKRKGEEALIAMHDKHFIIRTAWLYGTVGPSFVHTMVRLFRERDAVSVVNDQIGSPTYTGDLAEAVLAFIEKDSRAYGVYHYSNEGSASWFEFACEIYRVVRDTGLATADCRIIPISSADYPVRAHRPAYSLLCKDKIRDTLALDVPLWSHSLRRFLSEDYERWNGR